MSAISRGTGEVCWSAELTDHRAFPRGHHCEHSFVLSRNVVLLSGPGELGRVACASAKRPQNTMFLISHFYFLESFIFSDFFHAVRLSAVTFCFCQLSSFLPDSNLLLGLSCRFSNQTPEQVSVLHQVRPLHSLSQVGVKRRRCLCLGNVFFCVLQWE